MVDDGTEKTGSVVRTFTEPPTKLAGEDFAYNTPEHSPKETAGELWDVP